MNFYVKQNDTAPGMLYRLRRRTGEVANLVGATVRFMMADRVDEPAVIVDAAGGVVGYDWTVTDTSIPGTFKAHYQVNYANGLIETFPNNGYILVTIGPEL